MATRHTLKLVAPWYRWARQREDGGTGLGPLPRATRPVFLKYTSIAQAVKLVLEDPQRNYVFHPEDQVAVTVGSPYSGPIRVLADRRVLVTPLRKLYRDTHDRGSLAGSRATPRASRRGPRRSRRTSAGSARSSCASWARSSSSSTRRTTRRPRPGSRS